MAWSWGVSVNDQMSLPQYIRLVNERMRRLESYLSPDALANALAAEGGVALKTEDGNILTIEG